MFWKRISILILVLGLGYLAGSYIGQPFSEGHLSGDIGKVKKHNEKVVSEEFKAIENKLKTDTTFMNQTLFSLGFISARVGEFEVNAQISADIASGISGMENEAKNMAALAVTAANASQNANNALQALYLIKDGQGLNISKAGENSVSDADLERFTNNTYTSFMLLNSTTDAARSFVAAADAILASGDNKDLAFARDLWVSYNSFQAAYNNDNESLAYWTGLSRETDEKSTGEMLAALDASKLNKLQVSAALNQALFNNESLGKEMINFNNSITLNFRNSSTLDFRNSITLDFRNSSTLDCWFMRNSQQLSSSSSLMNHVLSNMPSSTLNFFI